MILKKFANKFSTIRFYNINIFVYLEKTNQLINYGKQNFRTQSSPFV